MKKSIVFLLGLVSGNLMAQTLEIEYEFKANLTRLVEYKSKLLANTNTAKFIYQSIQKEDVSWSKDSNSVVLNLIDTNHYVIFTDRANNTILEVLKGFKQKDNYLVNDTITNINWVLINEFKKIGNYECKKAIGDFRGRRYEAWYTIELPISFGPFKLHGLPGAILEASDTNKEITFYATRIKASSEGIVFTPPNYKIISRHAYRKEINDKLDSLLKNIASKSDRDFQFSAKISSIKSIEID